MKKLGWFMLILGISLSGVAAEKSVILDSADQVVDGVKQWSGPSDCSATATLSWEDAGDVRIEITVIDDTLFSDGAQVYENDSVEVYMDLRPGKKRGKNWYDRGTFQLAVAADSGEAAWNQGPASMHELAMVPGAEIQSVRTETGYTVSILLPAAGLKENHFPVEDGFNLAIGINDFDAAGARSQMMSDGAKNNWETPIGFAPVQPRAIDLLAAEKAKTLASEQFPTLQLRRTTDGAAPDRAVYEITDDVLIKNPPRFGINVELPRFNHWMDFRPVNQWARLSGFEPVIYRFQRTATGGSETALEDTADNGLAWWNSFQGDWWAGAEAIVYRPTTDNSMKVLRSGKVKSSDCGKGRSNSLVFEEPGPAVKAGDLYQLSIKHLNVPPLRQDAYRRYGVDRYLNGSRLKPADRSIELHYDPENVAPNGGETSLKVELTQSGQGGFASWWLANPEKFPAFAQLPACVDEFQVRFMARQEGLGGDLTFTAGNFKKSFSVGKKWKEIEFSMPAEMQQNLTTIGISASGPGTFWIDNLAISDPDYEFAKPYPFVVEALKRAKPGVLRLWVAYHNISGLEFDDTLESEFLRDTHLSIDSMHKPTSSGNLHDELELCQEVGADPWIVISPSLSQNELAALMEYLGGPASTPYGKKRKALGQAEPWSDLFNTIHIELGNEQWGSGFTTVFGIQGGGLYGRFAQMQFSELKKSPYYVPEKFNTIANGFSKNVAMFNNRCIDAAQGAADAIDIGLYLRGGWDTEDIISDNDDPLSDETLFNQLYYFRRMIQPLVKNALELAADYNSGLAIYEMGPGYDLPGPNVKQDPRDEITGKSLLLAVTTLDAFMFGQEHDIKPMNFYTFRPGTRWATHADRDLTREHTAWLALMMRNLYCTGDLMVVNTLEETIIDLPTVKVGGKGNFGEVKETELPALLDIGPTRAFAYSDEESCSVLMFSRNLHEPTEITLKFPFTPEANGTLYSLTHENPLASNITEMQVPIREKRVSKITKEYTITLPPHSVYLLRVGKTK